MDVVVAGPAHRDGPLVGLHAEGALDGVGSHGSGPGGVRGDASIIRSFGCGRYSAATIAAAAATAAAVAAAIRIFLGKRSRRRDLLGGRGLDKSGVLPGLTRRRETELNGGGVCGLGFS